MNLFSLGADQIAIRDMALTFAADKIAPHAVAWVESEHFPIDVLREAASLGMAGIYTSEEFGGSGMTRLDAVGIGFVPDVGGTCTSPRLRGKPVLPCGTALELHTVRQRSLAIREEDLFPFTTK